MDAHVRHLSWRLVVVTVALVATVLLVLAIQWFMPRGNQYSPLSEDIPSTTTQEEILSPEEKLDILSTLSSEGDISSEAAKDQTLTSISAGSDSEMSEEEKLNILNAVSGSN